ncbi:TPA: hypothetical protein HA239_00685 [Candidatus Woesearchaeota archaeon]|nr:hypothetical protein QT06_C0001G0177 [archaeon GW2011_AR15]MBS3104020.1 hypothetical protein [Candidatus Woesearchaeota archaeon]HIH40913.1 hypothetical protein [Candidatus Woesearchaeota archaeon]
MAVKTKTSAADEKLDSLLGSIMQPAERRVERQAGDTSPYQAILPMDLYTTRILSSMLKTPAAQKNLEKISDIEEFYQLLLADLFVSNAGTEESKKSMEEIMMDDSSSIYSKSKDVAGIFYKSLPEGEVAGQAEKLKQVIGENYINNNRETIESMLSKAYNTKIAVNNAIARRSIIPRWIFRIAAAAIIGAAVYFGLAEHHRQLEYQAQYGQYVEDTYGATLPDNVYDEIIPDSIYTTIQDTVQKLFSGE